MALNFRDAADLTGGRVRAGLLYRSGNVEAQADAQFLRHLGIGQRYDLRSAPEALAHSSALSGAGLHAPMPQHIVDTGLPMQVLANPDVTPADVRAAMVGLYRGFVVTFAPVLANILRQLAVREAPALIHCAVGKDRTGITLAVILSVLDVPRTVIFADYMLSNAAYHPIKESILRRHPQVADLPEAVLQPVTGVDPAYLQAFLNKTGPVCDWLIRSAGLEPEVLTGLRARLSTAG